MGEETKRPLVPLDGAWGDVVDLADQRIKRGRVALSAPPACVHRRLIFCTSERRIWCEDCNAEVAGFDAVVAIAERVGKMQAEAKARMAKAAAAMDGALVSRAAKAVDRLWRGRNMAPCCPHCSVAILPEDVLAGLSCVSREMESARRKRKKPDA